MSDEPMTNDESTPPDQEVDMVRHMVPSFFVHEDEPALRAQVGWTGRNLGLSDDFYARFLRVPEATFRDWRLGRGELPADGQDALRGFWYTVQLVLDFTQMDVPGARAFLERRMRVEHNTEFWTDPFTPPWDGSCMKSYLEAGGPGVLRDANRFLAMFGAGNPQFS